ncbi:MAG TPA: VOC family protein [Myxococcaceae bacterium]|nr:VOC family protein [Myxococcaceae bacterium]
MPKLESLGLLGIEAAHWYVHDLERSRRFYAQGMDFAEVGESDPDLTAKGRQKSLVFAAGDVTLIVSQPQGDGGRAARWLSKHPDGVGTLWFRVKDVERTFRLLEKRGATMIDDIQRATDDRGGKLAWFSITTPFGDSTFRFIQRDGYRTLYPGMVLHSQPRGGRNRFGFTHVDHVTSNFQTLLPAILWMENVLGLEQFWQIEFHTGDSQERFEQGSGLRSTVMWDPESTVKFANNEPSRPNFKASQINIFHEDNRGDGIQHLALAVKDILPAVEGLRATKMIDFMETPDSYYDNLQKRIEVLNIKRIDEKPEELRRLRILIDGGKEHSYLLQIFMKDAATLYREPGAGPFFYEIIQRKGDRGFGAGNFRSLFESIEREQRSQGRI